MASAGSTPPCLYQVFATGGSRVVLQSMTTVDPNGAVRVSTKSEGIVGGTANINIVVKIFYFKIGDPVNQHLVRYKGQPVSQHLIQGGGHLPDIFLERQPDPLTEVHRLFLNVDMANPIGENLMQALLTVIVHVSQITLFHKLV